MLNKTKLAAVLIVIVVRTSGASFPSARIKGTIYDSNHAVVTNARVVFSSNGRSYEALTNQEGNYDTNLPAGLYGVIALSPGFCPSKRALFQVAPSSETILNVTLVVCPLAYVLKMDKAGKYLGEEDRYVDPFKSDNFVVKDSSPLHLLIRYGRRQRDKGILEYEGPKPSHGVPSAVTTTYDKLTICANHVRFNTQTHRLIADGDVVVEDGANRRKFKHVEINFKSTQPIANLKGRT